MSKKFIINAIMAMAAIAALSSCCNGSKSSDCCGEGSACCKSEFSKKLPIGVQLYSVRTDLEKDFYGTLKAIKEMGYAGVEFYGEYYGNSAVQVKKWCTELGLIPFSNHIPFQAMIDDIDKVIEENTILGVQYVVFPYMDEASRPGIDLEQFKKTVAKIGECGAKVSEAGFQLLYHNHDFEFVPIADGGLGYDYIFGQNEKKNLQTELDVCWCDYSGNNPAEYLTKYAGRIPVVHMKDYKLEGKLSSAPYALIGISTDNSMKDDGGWFEYRPLGEGQVDIPAVIKAAIDGGAQWLCVEQDEPSQGRSRLEGVAKSTEYLRALDLM
ncbi:MAG: sugar phosphate isomerase/epimerase [Bacteroidales bacterium]|nr:sugar phosphate isomerase/epimerase [Candidatus Cryptobacteroides onthequi]